MSVDTIDSSPTFADFTPLDEHESQTPGTFFGGKPVLHLHCPGAKLKAAQEQLAAQPALSVLQSGSTAQVDGGSESEIVIDGIDVWITSKHLTLWSETSAKGVQIAYPTITITAQDGDAVLLELNFTDQNANDDDDIDFMQMRILPDTVTKHAVEGGGEQTQQANGEGRREAAHALWQAIFDCQELNPDPQTKDDDGEEVFDETAPGATGWITADNMQDFLDEDGNLNIPEDAAVYGDAEEDQEGGANGGLGSGAGQRRTAADVDAADGVEEDEAKWRRTD